MQQYYTASCRTIRRPQSGRRRNLEVPKGAESGAASAAGALAEEGSVGEEGRHDISVVGNRDIVQRGDASRDRISRQEPEDTKHGKSAIVDLHQEALVLLLLGHLLGEAEGVVQVQHPVDVVAEVLEGRVVARTAPPHVVLPLRVAAAALVPELEEPDHGDDLPAGRAREG